MKIRVRYYNLELHSISESLSNMTLDELKQYFVEDIMLTTKSRYECNMVNSKSTIEEVIKYMNGKSANIRYQIIE